jgi:hypothetical protein
MKQMYHLKVLVSFSAFLGFSLSSAPLIVPITFRPSLGFKHTEKELFSAKVNSVLVTTFTNFEAFMSKHNLSEASDSLRFIRNGLSRFSIDTLDKNFDAILAIKDTCADLGSEGLFCYQQLYTAIYLKAAFELCRHADEIFVEDIKTLEKNADFWDEQHVHSSFYFFHRSPLNWFKKGSRKREILSNRKCISDVLHQYHKALGENALLRAEFNDRSSIDEQFAWIKRCCVDISKICLKNPLNSESITQENCGQIIKQLYLSLNNQGKHVQRQVRRATMPSHVERNWALYTVGCSLAIVGYFYYKKNPNFVSSQWDFIKRLGVENYNKYLNKPVQDIGEAIGFKKSAEDGLFNSKELGKDISVGLNKILDNIGEKGNENKNNIDIENVRTIYIRTAQEYRDFHNKNFKNVVHWDPTNNQINEAAQNLDKRFLREIYDVYAQDCDNAGYMQIKSVINKAVPLFNVTGQVAAYRGSKIAEGLVELMEPMVKFIQFGMKQSEIMVTQTRLTIASLALLPAVGIMWGGFKAIRSFGGFLLPKGYDDTPVKNYITKMQHLLDDIVYINALKTYDTLDAQSVGKLLYYSTQLENEITHLSEKNRIVLKDLLEKFYITNDLKGKHMYLKKMLHEYESWSRFIHR